MGSASCTSYSPTALPRHGLRVVAELQGRKIELHMASHGLSPIFSWPEKVTDATWIKGVREQGHGCVLVGRVPALPAWSHGFNPPAPCKTKPGGAHL